jgi:hypothetical protein
MRDLPYVLRGISTIADDAEARRVVMAGSTGLDPALASSLLEMVASGEATLAWSLTTGALLMHMYVDESDAYFVLEREGLRRVY